MNIGTRFANTMNAAGVKVHSAVLLGKWLHIDTNKSEEMRIRHALTSMGARAIKVLSPGIDGEHLDGSRHHRIVAVF